MDNIKELAEATYSSRELGDTGISFNPARVRKKLEELREKAPGEQSDILMKISGISLVITVAAAVAAWLVGE